MRQHAQRRLHAGRVREQVEDEDEILALLLAEDCLLGRHLLDLLEHVRHAAAPHKPEQGTDAAAVADGLRIKVATNTYFLRNPNHNFPKILQFFLKG